MSDQQQQQKNKEINNRIAKNEAKRAFFSDVRVSTWAILLTIVAGLIVVSLYWSR